MRIGTFVAVAVGTIMVVNAKAEPVVLSPDKSVPVRIEASRTDVHENGKSATFSDAQVFQGDMHWQCKSLNVTYYDDKTPQQLECEP